MSSRSIMYINATLILLIISMTSTCKAQFYSNNNVLNSGDTLYAGQSLTYNSYQFTIQSDCNLVLYDSGRAIWASNTDGQGYNCYLSMQTDGNLVVYTQDRRALWASNTGGNQGNYVLVLQRDRNVVIYGCPSWSTQTNTYGNGVSVVLNVGENNATKLPFVVNEIKTNDEKIKMVTKN